MNQQSLPIQSSNTLLKASLFALILAIVVLVLVILPAEYDVDPTGFGKLTGLSQLSSVENTSESEAMEPKTDNPFQQSALQQDTVTIEVMAGKGLEYKFYLEQHEKLVYDWETDGDSIYFDFHGEPEGDTTGFYESFTIATSNKMQGTLTTPFPGSHGWYWRNDSDNTVIITLSTKGPYKIIGIK